MKKCVFVSMLLILVSFSVLISPLQEMGQYSFNSPDEPVISTFDTVLDDDVVTESVPTIIHKSQIKSLFPSTDSTHVLRGKRVPFRFINHVFLSSEIAGFINVVQHQSNYLPYYM